MSDTNIEIHFSSKSHEWETPKDFFKKLDDEFHFEVDAAATDENHLCPIYFSQNNSALDKNWKDYGSVVWMNPPYGREMSKFIRKAYEESQKGCLVVCLIPSRTDTKAFVDICSKGEIRFIAGRLKFVNRTFPTWNKEGDFKLTPAPFPSCLVVFGGKNDGKVSFIKQK